jgi:hypothetical protein
VNLGPHPLADTVFILFLALFLLAAFGIGPAVSRAISKRLAEWIDRN